MFVLLDFDLYQLLDQSRCLAALYLLKHIKLSTKLYFEVRDMKGGGQGLTLTQYGDSASMNFAGISLI